MNKKTDKDNSPVVRKLGLFVAVLTDLVAYTGVGVAIGYYLWKKQNLPGWIVIVTSLLGLGWAFYRIYKLSEKEL